MATTNMDVGAQVNGVVAPERELVAPERDYPDWSFIPDPEPIEDAMQQEFANTKIRDLIRTYFADRPDALVVGEANLAWDRADRNSKLVPDLLVAFGVNAEQIMDRNGYLIWEVGKPPDVVMEVASRRTKDNDLTDKRDRYASLGISEYWRIDPTSGALYGDPIIGEYLVNGEYRRYAMRAEPDGLFWWGYSRALGINLCWDGDGGRFITQDPKTGAYRIGVLEVERERDEAREQAAQEREGRIQERDARQAAEARTAQERQARVQEQNARQAAEIRAADAEARNRELEAEIARLRDQRR